MPIRITLPNGRTMSVPDDTSDEEMDALVEQEMADDAPEMMAAHEPEPLHDRQDRFIRSRGADAGAMSELPMVGGLVGGMVGGIPGAAIGGGLGSLGRDVLYAARGDARSPRTSGDVLGNAALNAGWQAAMGVGGKVLGKGLEAGGRFITRRAVPFIRSAIKGPAAAARKRAKIEGILPDEVLNEQAQFIADEGLRTAKQGQDLIRSTGDEVDFTLAQTEGVHRATTGSALTIDSAKRIPKYLDALLTKIQGRPGGRPEGQMLPGRDRAAVQNIRQELMEDSPLSHSLGPIASRPRALRTDITPSEAMKIVRNKSFFNKDATEGGLAAGKAIELALRDGIKEVAPRAAPILHRQGRAIDVTPLLDRSEWLAANRDQQGMGSLLGFAAGRPILGAVMQAVKESQLGLGVSAAKYGPRLTRSGKGVGDVSPQVLRAALLLLQQQQQQDP